LPSSRITGLSCVLDTDIVIDFLRRRDYARQLLEDWAGRGLLAISTLTHLEVYQGMKRGEEQTTNLFLDGLIPLTVDISVARRAGRLLREMRSKGVTTGIGDAIIAATALEYKVPLLTNNVEHYDLEELKVVRGLG
jgi:predicted nucleic acid-binding protein